ncbi:MAG: hypothetical protein Q4D62_12470 [Planctomycetia bacterium]|nr:hypothetical protein [Planctomycetia bacterium]
MTGYKIGDKTVAQTLVNAGRTKPWDKQKTTVGMNAPTGIFLRAKLGIVKDFIPARTETDGVFYPTSGKVYVAKLRDGESTPLEKLTLSDGGFTEETVFNFSENSFESGELVMTLTDVFNRVYILSGKTSEGGESAILCKVTGGSPESGYSVLYYENGAESDYTGRGTLFFTELALGAQVPVNSWVIGHPMATRRTGGNDE